MGAGLLRHARWGLRVGGIKHPGLGFYPGCAGLYGEAMSERAPRVEEEEAELEARALAAAIAESDADPRTVPHEAVRAWLLRLAEGEFNAPPPEPR